MAYALTALAALFGSFAGTLAALALREHLAERAQRRAREAFQERFQRAAEEICRTTRLSRSREVN